MKENIIKISLEEAQKTKGKTDWERVKAMSEKEIEEEAWSDPDAQPLPDELLNKAVVVDPGNKSHKSTYIHRNNYRQKQ